MTTLVIFDSFGGDELKYCLVHRDLLDLHDKYMNGDVNDEDADKLNALYEEIKDSLVPFDTTQLPKHDRVIVTGFVP